MVVKFKELEILPPSDKAQNSPARSINKKSVLSRMDNDANAVSDYSDASTDDSLNEPAVNFSPLSMLFEGIIADSPAEYGVNGSSQDGSECRVSTNQTRAVGGVGRAYSVLCSEVSSPSVASTLLQTPDASPIVTVSEMAGQTLTIDMEKNVFPDARSRSSQRPLLKPEDSLLLGSCLPTPASSSLARVYQPDRTVPIPESPLPQHTDEDKAAQCVSATRSRPPRSPQRNAVLEKFDDDFVCDKITSPALRSLRKSPAEYLKTHGTMSGNYVLENARPQNWREFKLAPAPSKGSRLVLEEKQLEKGGHPGSVSTAVSTEASGSTRTPISPSFSAGGCVAMDGRVALDDARVSSRKGLGHGRLRGQMYPPSASRTPRPEPLDLPQLPENVQGRKRKGSLLRRLTSTLTRSKDDEPIRSDPTDYSKPPHRSLETTAKIHPVTSPVASHGRQQVQSPVPSTILRMLNRSRSFSTASTTLYNTTSPVHQTLPTKSAFKKKGRLSSNTSYSTRPSNGTLGDAATPTVLSSRKVTFGGVQEIESPYSYDEDDFDDWLRENLATEDATDGGGGGEEEVKVGESFVSPRPFGFKWPFQRKNRS